MTYDVIVVGAGGSGLAAALSAAQHGARVLVLEARAQTGGTTGIAVGSFTAAGTTLQQKRGIQDDWQAHAEDAAKFAAPDLEARNNERLRRYFLSEAAATYEWLAQLGLSFVGPHPEPPNRCPRMHNVVPGARAYIAALELALRRYPHVNLQCEAVVRQLVRDGDRVCGVMVDRRGSQQEIHAQTVILAGGDYANNSDLIAQYKGEQFRNIEGINPFATGLGHLLARDAGAQLVNMDVTYGPELRFVPASTRPFEQRLPVQGLSAKLLGWLARMAPQPVIRMLVKRMLVTWQHPENALFDDGAILLNAHGQRFVNEKAWPQREIAVADQPGKIAYLLLDQRLCQRYSTWPHFISTAPDIAYAYVADYLRLRRDVSLAAASFREAAAQRGLQPDQLQATVNEFNQYALGHSADAFGRTGDALPLVDGPCVLLGPVKAYFTTTEGGALVNQRLQVLDQQERPIPGLLACGQNGLGGMILWGHGLHIAWALTSGRLAGAAWRPQTE